MPSRMRLSAPTDGFIWLDSINEIVELVTPARLASARCDSLWRARMNRSRPPMSTLMPLVPVASVADRANMDRLPQSNQWLADHQKRTCCPIEAVALLCRQQR